MSMATSPLYRPELGVLDARQLELPGREPLAHLSNGGAEHAALLNRGRGAEALARRLFLRGQPRLTALRGEQPRVAVAGEDDVGEQVAYGVDHRRPSARI